MAAVGGDVYVPPGRTDDAPAEPQEEPDEGSQHWRLRSTEVANELAVEPGAIVCLGEAGCTAANCCTRSPAASLDDEQAPNQDATVVTPASSASVEAGEYAKPSSAAGLAAAMSIVSVSWIAASVVAAAFA